MGVRCGHLNAAGVRPPSTDARAQKNDIILELNRRIEAENDMDQLSIALRPIIGRDF